MDFEPWWLIFIPVLFGLGWLAARFDIRQMLSENRTLPDSYFKGLSFLLNEQPDRAIDAFVEVAKLDPETTELHFALGSLFRRRGEMERAIRVHQSLLNRADLPQQEREHALFELAQDFLKAGMLDRAESSFRELQKSQPYSLDALRALIRIFESEHDWPRAIEAIKTFRGLIKEPVPQLVHYYCEQAQTALARKPADLDAAHAALEEADHAASFGRDGSSDASRARLTILHALVAEAEKNDRQAMLHYETILTDLSDYAGLVAARLLACYSRLGQSQAGLTRLRQHYAEHPSLEVFNVVFRQMRETQGVDPAWAFARDALRLHPSLLGLDRMLEAELSAEQGGASQAPVGADIALLHSLIHKHSQRLDRYVCQSCGFHAKRFYWQCPGCNEWETYAPRRMEELA